MARFKSDAQRKAAFANMNRGRASDRMNKYKNDKGVYNNIDSVSDEWFNDSNRIDRRVNTNSKNNNISKTKDNIGTIVYWRMQNGHEHSFLTYEDDWRNDTNIPGGYLFRDGREVKNQGDYFEYVQESERTYDEYVEDFKADAEGIKYGLDNRYIMNYDESDGSFDFI